MLFNENGLCDILPLFVCVELILFTDTNKLEYGGMVLIFTSSTENIDVFLWSRSGIVMRVIGFEDGGNNEEGFFDLTRSENTVLVGSLLVIPGAVIGGIVSAFKIKISLNGSQRKFAEKRKKFRKFSMR